MFFPLSESAAKLCVRCPASSDAEGWRYGGSPGSGAEPRRAEAGHGRLARIGGPGTWRPKGLLVHHLGGRSLGGELVGWKRCGPFS